MYLIPNINLTEFLQIVLKCKGEVYFSSKDGDVLNLKSALSQYVFATVCNSPDFCLLGEISCDSDEDRELLKKYLH